MTRRSVEVQETRRGLTDPDQDSYTPRHHQCDCADDILLLEVGLSLDWKQESVGENKMKPPLYSPHCIRTHLFRHKEYGGLLANWKNGEFEVIADWETDKELEAAWQLVENHMDSGRDEIYIAVVKQARGCGCCVTSRAGLLPLAALSLLGRFNRPEIAL